MEEEAKELSAAQALEWLLRRVPDAPLAAVSLLRPHAAPEVPLLLISYITINETDYQSIKQKFYDKLLHAKMGDFCRLTITHTLNKLDALRVARCPLA